MAPFSPPRPHPERYKGIHRIALKVRVLLPLAGEGGDFDVAVVVAGVEGGVAGEGAEGVVEAVVHFYRVAALEVAAAAAVDEEGVAADQELVAGGIDQEALGAGGVAGGVDAAKAQASHVDHLTALIRADFACWHLAHQLRGVLLVGVDSDAALFEELGDAVAVVVVAVG